MQTFVIEPRGATEFAPIEALTELEKLGVAVQ